MRKKFARVLFFLLTLGILTSCSGETVSLLDFIGEESNDIDLGGLTFRIRKDGDLPLDEVAEGEVFSAREEKFIKRLQDIENDYNCTIINTAGRADEYATFYVSGIPTADILDGATKNIYDLHMAGYLVPINEFSEIDLSDDKYGGPAFIETYTWNGKTIGFFPQHWGTSVLGFSNALYYNPEIFTNLGIANPNELYENGEWNWDALTTIGKACASVSTEDKPLYLTPVNRHFSVMMMFSNGGEYVTLDSNGNYRYALSDPKVAEAVDFTYSLVQSGYAEKTASGVDILKEFFADGRYALYTEYSFYGISFFNYEMNSVGYCYMPQGPNESDVTRGILSVENNIYAVTREKNDSFDELGKFVSLLCEPLDEVAGDWKYEYINENFFDEKSAEVYMTMLENVYFDRMIFAAANGDYSVYNAIENASKDGALTEKIQALEKKVNARLDSNINSWK